MSIVKSCRKWVEASWVRAKRAVAESPWGKLLGRGALSLIGFALLALVGSGRMARWLSPSAPRLGIAVAEAALPPKAPAASPDVTATASSSDEPQGTGAPDVGTATGEPIAAPEVGDAGAASGAVSADGKIILNLATEEDLRRLPGVGHGRAQAILALRARLKKFSRVEDLLKVKGMGRKGLARLRPLIRVD